MPLDDKLINTMLKELQYIRNTVEVMGEKMNTLKDELGGLVATFHKLQALALKYEKEHTIPDKEANLSEEDMTLENAWCNFGDPESWAKSALKKTKE